MLKMQTRNHYFRLNTTTDEKYILKKIGLKFKILSSPLPHSKSYLPYFLLKNMDPLELRDPGSHSETSKNDWIKLCASVS